MGNDILGDAVDVLGLATAVAAAPFTAGTSLAAAAPFLGIATSVGGIAEGVENQNQANSAAKAAQAGQNAELGNVNTEISNLNQPVPLQPLLNAEGGAAETLKSQAGGVPNIGALVKSLFGTGLSSALQAALQQTGSNQAAAGNLALGAAGGANAGTGYAGAAAQAAKAAGGANFATGAGSIFSNLGKIGKPAAQPGGAAITPQPNVTDNGSSNGPSGFAPSSGYIPPAPEDPTLVSA